MCFNTRRASTRDYTVFEIRLGREVFSMPTSPKPTSPNLKLSSIKMSHRVTYIYWLWLVAVDVSEGPKGCQKCPSNPQDGRKDLKKHFWQVYFLQRICCGCLYMNVLSSDKILISEWQKSDDGNVGREQQQPLFHLGKAISYHRYSISRDKA